MNGQMESGKIRKRFPEKNFEQFEKSSLQQTDCPNTPELNSRSQKRENLRNALLLLFFRICWKGND